MSIISRKELKIDSDDKDLLKILEYRKQRNNKTQTVTDETISQPSMRQVKKDTKNISNYRPSRMSDSFMPSAPTLQETVSQKQLFETVPIQLPAHIFDVEDEMYIEEERALDEPFVFQQIPTQEVKGNNNDVTAGLDQQELMDYMRKNQRVNHLMVSIIVGVIVVVAIIAIIFLVINLRRAGQTSPLGGI